MKTPQTMFQIVAERGLIQTAAETAVSKPTLSRCVRAVVGIRDNVLDAFEVAYGGDFSRHLTVLVWDQMRRAKRDERAATRLAKTSAA